MLWPALVNHDFRERTDRIGWRYWEEGVDLVEIPSIGTLSDSVGCTSFSFGAHVAGLPYWLKAPGRLPQKEGRPRPHYWHGAPVTRMLETAEFRVVSDRQLEAEGGAVALAQAVASLHAEALRAQSWISLSG